VVLFGAAVGLVAGSKAPSPGIAFVAGAAALGLLWLAVARYDTAAMLGFLLFGVLLVEPAVPDVIFGMLIIVTVLTGRWTFRRVPSVVLYVLGAFLLLNLLSVSSASSVSHAAFFMTITTFLALFAVWLTGYVDSAVRARKMVEALIVGASVTATLAVAALFVSFPGSDLLTYPKRAKGLFDDPNVFGPFMVVPLALILAELVEPRLLPWPRRWLFVVLLICGSGVLFSYSRAAWLNAILALTTMVATYALRRRSARRAIAALGLGLLAAGLLFVFLVLTGSVTFLEQRAQLQQYDTERFRGQEASMEMASNHVLGIGPGQYVDYAGIAAHSTYLRALGEQGAVGLALIVLLLLGTLVLAAGNVVHGRTTFGISSVPLLGLWAGLIANGFFVDTLHWRHLWLVAGLIWAGACAGQRPVENDAAARTLAPSPAARRVVSRAGT
jgi:O-antigen ligase